MGRYKMAIERMQAGQCDGPAWSAIAADPDFRKLPSSLRSLTYVSLAMCVGGEPTHDWVRRATDEDDAPPVAWALRFVESTYRKDADDALRSVERLGELTDWTELSIYRDDAVFRLARDLTSDPVRKRRLLAYLDRGHWTPAAPIQDGSGLWRDYSLILLEDGKTADAVRVAHKVTQPEILFRMRLDKRFDPVTAADPKHFDVVYAAFATLERNRKLYPASGSEDGAYEIIEDLRLLGRLDEALSFADATLAKPEIKDSDGRDYRNWIEDRRAYVLFDLGRYEEGLAVMRKAAARQEGDFVNVSQVINLAGLLNAVGRHEEALSTLAAFDGKRPASEYGDMWVATERTCASSGLARDAEAAKTLAFTAEHAKDNRNARIKALLCVNDLAGAADAYAAWLLDPAGRADALLQLSRFQEVGRPPFDEMLHRRFVQVRDSSAIQAAVAKVGRTEDLALRGNTWIDFY